MTQSGRSPPVYVHCTSIALTHKIHTLSTLQSEMLGVAQQHRLFPKLGGACSATGLRRRILSLECLLRPWRDVGGGSLPVFWVGVGRQPLRCFTLRARCNDNPGKVLGPTAVRPNRYGSEPRRIARSRNNRRRHHASGRRRPKHTKPPDIVARVTGQALSERLGRQFVIENRPGAGSNIGTEIVVRAPPDGYTLLLAVSSSAINATLYSNLSFNFIRDIAPVAMIGLTPFVMVVNPKLPTKSVAEFIAYAKANPGKINMASQGNGLASHLMGELFKMLAGVNLVHVPYSGSYAADLLGGQVQVAFS